MEPSPRTVASPARRRAAQRAFIVPGDLPGPSGGSTYNRHVMEIWDREGLAVAEEQLAGAWPHPDDAARKTLGELLGRYREVLIDGIIASAAPEQMAQAQAGGVQVTVLMHLPLPAETGLTTAQQIAAAAVEHRALQHAALVVCTSEWAQREVASRYGSLPTAVAVPGADTAPVSHGSSPPRLLFLATISPRKNPLMLLRALQPLKHHQWQLTVAGPDGSDPDYVRAVDSAAQHYAGRAALPGPLTGAELDRLWEGTDLLVLPSLAETYGMVVTEAVARGVPALVGAGTGAEEALAAGQPPSSQGRSANLPGRAVDPTDEAAWTEALRQWLTNDDVRSRWRANAGEHRDRLPTWSNTAKQLRTALRW